MTHVIKMIIDSCFHLKFKKNTAALVSRRTKHSTIGRVACRSITRLEFTVKRLFSTAAFEQIEIEGRVYRTLNPCMLLNAITDDDVWTMCAALVSYFVSRTRRSSADFYDFVNVCRL